MSGTTASPPTASIPAVSAPSAGRVRPGQPPGPDAWRLVSRFLIRSAGFPFEITEFGADRVGPVLALRAELRAEAAKLREQWPTWFDAAVRELERGGADRSAFKALYRARREVGRHHPVPPDAAAHLDAGWVAAWQRCLARLDAADRALDEAVRTATEYGRTRLRALLADGRFAAALTVSNPELADRLRRSLCADPEGRRASTRQDERVVYAYAQRLATKNETISFFGPIDYGRFGGPDPVRLRYAGQPVQRRWARLSHWAVQLLADRIAEDPGLAGHLPLRLREGCAVTAEQTLLIAATGRRIPLHPAQAEVLALVTSGGVTVDELTARHPDPAVPRDLLARKVITCRPLVPTALDDPASWLLDLLAGLRRAGVAAAAPWQDLLSGLTGEARALAEHDDTRRPAALAGLETAFSAATGHPARRGAGAHYADRLLVTEDCRGGVSDCVIGTRQAQALARRLAPALALCASYSVLVQQAVQARALDLHAGLARRGPVSYLHLVAELDRALPVEEVTADPHLVAWLDQLDRLVGSATTAGVARVDPVALGPLLRDPPAGLVVSPDIFVWSDALCAAARGADARHADARDADARGADPAGLDLEQAEVVIGEIHHGAQVWSHLSVFDPDPVATGREVAAVTGAGGELAALVCRRTQGKAFERELPGPVVRFRAATAQAHPRELAAEDLTVHEVAGTLRLTAPDGTAVRLQARHPRSPSNWLFGPPPVVAPVPLRTATHAPRVRIGDVVAWRERWRLDTGQLRELTGARHPAALVRAAAELRERLGLPRLVFARAATARKPVFADLHCPTSLQHLAHYLRKSPTAELTEMLPEPRHWWLRPAGHPVSSEWRLTLGWAGPPAPDPGAEPHA